MIRRKKTDHTWKYPLLGEMGCSRICPASSIVRFFTSPSVNWSAKVPLPGKPREAFYIRNLVIFRPIVQISMLGTQSAEQFLGGALSAAFQ